MTPPDLSGGFLIAAFGKGGDVLVSDLPFSMGRNGFSFCHSDAGGILVRAKNQESRDKTFFQLCHSLSLIHI